MVRLEKSWQTDILKTSNMTQGPSYTSIKNESIDLNIGHKNIVWESYLPISLIQMNQIIEQHVNMTPHL